MDITLLLALCSVLILIILGVILFIKTNTQPSVQSRPQPRQVDVPRRAHIVRNQRVRLRANVARHEELREEDELQEENTEISDEKIGTKKRAKLEAKAEKKAQRELEEKLREEKKKRDQLAEQERQKQQQKDEAEEKRREEEARKAKEEEERREHEEYLKMKEAFSVEEEGYEEGDEPNNSLQDFVNYIKENKVINIEDLAVHFRLKTQATIERIQDLQKDQILTGVLDDRGKFIYISMEELQSVAKFIKQRGRVSISELADSSNKLINLSPNKVLLS